MSKLVFGYWKVRGLGQHLRLLLAYTGVDFEEVQYENREQWFDADKKNLGFDFPNLPYLIDGDFKLTESAAIAKYIINRSGKTDLLGKNVEDSGLVNNLIGVLTDALKDIKGLFWNKDYENLKIEYLEKARPKLDAIKKFVGDNQFAIGYLTLVDFLLAENLYYFETLYPSEKSNYGFWWRIRHNFESLPEIKAYYTRPTALKGPFYPPYAALSPKLNNVKLAYWGIRGLGQIPRLLLAYSGVEFEDYHYTNGEKWFGDDKKNLGLHFPNLPYLIDGEFDISESGAIHRYIIKRWGHPELLGKNIQDNARLESFLSVFSEIGQAVRGLFFNKEHETARAELLQKYGPKLEQLDKYVGEQQFVLGYLTLADFAVAEDSYYIETVFPEQFKTWGFLNRIRDSFNSQPQIAAYYKSQSGFKGEFYPQTALIHVTIPAEFKTEQ
jgi:glutathione S-transferase